MFEFRAIIEALTVITVKQVDFLSNEKNKSRLISFLSVALRNQGIEVREASDDADTLIIKTAIKNLRKMPTLQ